MYITPVCDQIHVRARRHGWREYALSLTCTGMSTIAKCAVIKYSQGITAWIQICFRVWCSKEKKKLRPSTKRFSCKNSIKTPNKICLIARLRLNSDQTISLKSRWSRRINPIVTITWQCKPLDQQSHAMKPLPPPSPLLNDKVVFVNVEINHIISLSGIVLLGKCYFFGFVKANPSPTQTIEMCIYFITYIWYWRR